MENYFMSVRQMFFIVFSVLNFLNTTNCFAISFHEHNSNQSPSYKTSFNCNKAKTKVELAICHSKELAHEDIVLSKHYHRLEKLKTPDLVVQQKIWLNERDGCFYSLALEKCLLNKYRERIAQLAHLKIVISSKYTEVEKLEKLDHPVLSVFKKYNMSLYDVEYSKDRTCPTFYVQFKLYPLSTNPHDLTIEYSHKVFTEILKANSSFPYAIVDKDQAFKVNVGYGDKAGDISIVRSVDVNSPTTCMDKRSSPDAKEFTVIAEMKKEILKSPYKASLRQADGNKITAYLYAEDEKSIPYDFNACTSGIKTRVQAKTGHYYIYLYDELTDSFYPNRMPIFQGDKPTLMGIEGAYFVGVPATQDKELDAIVVTQRENCQASFYESYSLWKDQTSLQKLKGFNGYPHLEAYFRDHNK